MPELLHPHVILRVQTVYNATLDMTQVVYACAAQRLGCSWGKVIQVTGDVLISDDSRDKLKAAEAALTPKATDKELD